jgi:hypothetical protein
MSGQLQKETVDDAPKKIDRRTKLWFHSVSRDLPQIDRAGFEATIFMSETVPRSVYFETIEWLMEKGKRLNVVDSRGRTPLMHACNVGSAEMVHYLMERNADPNITGGNGGTALMDACVKGHTEIVEYLLEQKADPDKVNEDGQTALFCAFESKCFEIVKYLIEKGVKF